MGEAAQEVRYIDRVMKIVYGMPLCAMDSLFEKHGNRNAW